MFKNEMQIANALKSPILSLTRRNKKFGTGFDFKKDGNKVTLQLMDDCAKYGSVIHEIDSFSDKEGYEFINEIVSQLEKEIIKL